MNVSARDRWFAAVVLAGTAAVIAAAVVFLRLGVEDPSPPSLIESPNPAIPGEILYADREGCLYLAPASGADRRQLFCSATPPRIVFFLDERRVGYVDALSYPEVLVVIDRESGRELERRPYAPSTYPFPPAAPDGTRTADRGGSELDLVQQGRIVGTLSFETESWRLQLAGWSPDSQWLALVYQPPRSGEPELWLVSRDGATRGTLAQDVAGITIAWHIDGVGIWPPPPE